MWTRGWEGASAFTYFSPFYLNYELKGFFDTPRPYVLDPSVVRSAAARETGTGPGFPSGHAQASMTYWGYLALRLRRGWFWAAAGLIIALISLSRVYLGVHLPIDVFGGLVVGVGVIALAYATDTLLTRVTPPLWLTLVLGIGVPLALHLVLPVPSSELLMGGLAAFFTAPALVPYRADASLWRRVLVSLLGLVLVFAVLVGSSLLLPGSRQTRPRGGVRPLPRPRLHRPRAGRPCSPKPCASRRDGRSPFCRCGASSLRSSTTAPTFTAGRCRPKRGSARFRERLKRPWQTCPARAPRIMAAGRTDAGVHALAMVAHYDTEDNIPVQKVPQALNVRLPRDVVVLKAEEAPLTFQSQFDCLYRRYLYRMRLVREGAQGRALERHHILFLSRRLNLDAMTRAAPLFEGAHDFAALATQETRGTERTLYVCRLEVKEPNLTLHVVGDGFLRNMVRAIVGTLLYVGEGKLAPEDVPRILASRDRQRAGPNVPPHGLYFAEAGYTAWAGLEKTDLIF